ncbi:hypothetical protein Tco_1136674 [Tanacetum coccineum]
MLAICAADTPVVFKAPKPSSNAERVPQGINPGAKPRHKKHLTSLKQSSVSSKEATKGGSSKAPTGSKTGHSMKRKDFSSAMDSNPSQPPVSTPVDTGMHKEDQQATGGPTSLGVTNEERANPQLSSGMSAFNLNNPIYSTSFIIHSDSASGNDASVVSTAEADPGNSAPNQTKSVSEGLETVLTQPIIGKGASLIARQIEEETSSSIKLEDHAKLVSHVQPSFKDLDSPEDDPVIVVDDTDEDGEDEIHAATNDETEDTLSQKHKLEFEKNKAEAALFKAQPSFPNVKQLNELLVKSLKTEYSNILSAHDFNISLPTELKDLPSKFNELTEEVKGLKKQVHELEIELPVDLKEIPTKLKDFTKTLNITQALNNFAQVLNSASSKAGDHSVPSVGQADTRPTEGEKDTNQATISQLFQRRANKNAAEKESTDTDSNDETHVTDSMVEPSRTKKLKKFDFITEDGRHIHLTEEEINHQKKLEEDAKVKQPNKKGKKGSITLKVYREDGTSEIIPIFKASDLHLGEWREVMKACPNRTGKGWETIYKKICTRMVYIHMTEAEVGINLDIPLSKQDPLDKLNDLANKKIKHDDDIHDYFKANKRLNSSVQYKDYLPGIVFNELILGPSASALQVLRRLGSIFTSVYVAVR